VLPQAAELYRRQIAQGLGGDERAALTARLFLRELLGRICSPKAASFGPSMASRQQRS